MLTDDDLDAMRETLEESLPETAAILRLTTTATETGGASESWATAATVAARLAPGSYAGSESDIASRLTSTRSWTITLPQGTDIRQADRIEIGSRTFEVVTVLSARSYQVSARVSCVEVE